MNSSRSKVVSSPYLLARGIEDLGILDGVTYFLQERSLSGVCPSNDEDTKMTTLAAEIDSFVQGNLWHCLVGLGNFVNHTWRSASV